ncbi:DNA methylase [Gordonia phage Getalong]|uniref:DNA methylase n=2 Tax=Getalongvirus TaxID=2733156 RepID=A0A386KHY4_9CAUD|nr:DNA methylase [Gordonia phage Getalong]YP_009819109.1 methyltransferase [Gordonia phage Asapag]AYD83927.1 DNA methylase [Gordonia phage Getalong]QAU07206.1 DNA methylase [Gordonia phage Asapag]
MSGPYYQDDLVTLYHGDCLDITDWLQADVLVTDPPYGMAHSSGWKSRPIANDETTEARDAVLGKWGPRPALMFGRWSVARPDSVRARLIWDKGEWPGMGDLKFPWGPSDEEIYILGDGWTGTREGTVIRVNRLTGGAVDHPTPKPIPLMERLIAKCPPGAIADPFAGSGSTLVAAANQGRRVIGVELEERYCELIAKRLSNQTMALDFGDAS